MFILEVQSSKASMILFSKSFLYTGIPIFATSYLYSGYIVSYS